MRPHEPTATIATDNLKKKGGVLDLVWIGAYMRAHKKGGRKRVTDERKIALAARPMRDRDVPVSEACGAVGVSRAALCRYLNPDGAPRG
jgi:hypothetical protein